MKIINYFGKEQKLYYEKLDNGLDVYIVPNKNRGNYHVDLVTKFGSNVQEFIPIGKKNYLKLPLGVAHFLEHKTFDMEDDDSFAFFSKYGTYVNAGTSYFFTRYYMDGKKKFKKNLDYLLNMVYKPYIPNEKVESEKNIIAEEIKMYDDEPEWNLDYAARNCVFKTEIVEKIAGTTDSIKEITADMLMKTYETFYQPSNMFLIACGNVNRKDVLEVINNNLMIKNAKTNYPIVYKKKKDDKYVVSEYRLEKANIVIPKLVYAFKFDLNEFSFLDYGTSRLYLNVIFSHLFGDSSEFSEKVLEKKLSVAFFIDHVSFDNIYAFSLESEGEYADLFKEEVDDVLKNILITEDDFIRIKKVWMALLVRSLDSNEAIANSITDDIIKGEGVVDQYEETNSLNYDTLLKVVSKLDFSNKSFVLMIPNEK